MVAVDVSFTGDGQPEAMIGYRRQVRQDWPDWYLIEVFAEMTEVMGRVAQVPTGSCARAFGG